MKENQFWLKSAKFFWLFSHISQCFTSFIRLVIAYVSLRSRFLPRFLRQDIDHRDFLRHSHFRLHFNVAQEQLFGAWRRGRESEERRETGPIEVRIGYFTASASNFATSKKAQESGKWSNQKAWTKPSHKSCNLARKIGSLIAEKWWLMICDFNLFHFSCMTGSLNWTVPLCLQNKKLPLWTKMWVLLVLWRIRLRSFVYSCKSSFAS